MTTTTASRPWSPTSRDRLIYQWVKFEGRSQGYAASALNLNQSTVSRIIDRYERWIAHGGPSQNGGLNRDERLRAQHYLTYERNEWIIASCMRLAVELEHLTDTSKSTTTHHCSDPTRELEVRTQHSILDRTGKVCRYLRLAHRVNMDQKKLVQEEDLPALEPFTLDPNEYSQANADARDGCQLDTPFQPVLDNVVPSRREGHEAEPALHSPAPEPATAASTPPFPAAPSPIPPVHNPCTDASPLNPYPTITSLEITPTKKQNPPAYAVATNPPETTDPCVDPLREILNATLNQPPPPIVLPLPFHISVSP